MTSAGPGETESSHFIYLLQQSREGSTDAIGLIMEAYRSFLGLHAGKYVSRQLRAKHGLSDLVQETITAAHQSIHDFAGNTEGEFRAWLLAIMSNQAANLANKYKTAKRDVDKEVRLEQANEVAEDLRVNQPSPSSMVGRMEDREILLRKVTSLPEAVREVILLRYREHLSFDDIAVRLNKSVDAVKKLWARGVDRLRPDQT